MAKRVRKPDPGRSRQSGELRSGTQVRTALIAGNTFAAKAVQYTVVDGLAIVEGDIVLGTEQQTAERTQQLRDAAAGGLQQGVLITGPQFRWPNCTVPFTIDPALPNQARVTDAIAHWHANTRFRFVARTSEADFVTFRPSSGCSSSVGKQGGQQFVNLGATCSTGNAIHEIGHVVGLWHEQSREDRDVFVTIHWDKIQAGMEHNFNQHITDGDDVGAYDYGSIMHYPRDAFSVDGSDTITPVTAASIGQRTALSAGDIAAANSMCPIVKSPLVDTRKEIIFDTRKEQIKDAIFDTRKELVLDTRKEASFDPPWTIAENLLTPGQVVINPGPRIGINLQPFAVATPHQAPGAIPAGAASDAVVADLDARLQGLADLIAQAESQREQLLAQYNETAALLKQAVAAHDSESQ